jgi:hypothetical protein
MATNAVEYKAGGLIRPDVSGQMRAWRQKAIANLLESAHGAECSDILMSRRAETPVDRYDHTRAPMRVRRMSDVPVDLDKHRGMAAQKATDIRRLLADVEANAKLLRDRQGAVEIELLAVPASSWPEAAAKARYVLNLYAAELATADTHHRDLIAAVLADFARLSGES